METAIRNEDTYVIPIINDDWEKLIFEQNSNFIDEELKTMDRSLRIGLDPSDPKHISKLFLRKEIQNAKYN
jgi:hypothetical protein